MQVFEMRGPFIHMLARLLAVALLVSTFAGCEEDDENTSVEAQEAYYVYVYSDDSSNIAAFSMNPESGQLEELDGSPYNAVDSGERLRAVPTLDALFLEFPLGNSVQVKRVDWSTGEASAVPNGVRAVTSNPGTFARVALSPDGKWLIAGDSSNAELHVNAIDPDTLALSAIGASPFALAAQPEFIVVHPSGEFVYAASSSSNAVYSFHLDPDTGELTPTSVPSFSIAPTFVSLATDPLGDFLLLSDNSSNLVSMRINQSTGNLSSDVSLNNGNTIYGLRMHPDGEAVYAGTDFGLFTYAFDRSTGEFTPFSGGSDYDWEFIDFTFTPNGDFVVIPDQANGAVMVREVNADGSLGEDVVAAADTGDQPLSFLVVDPDTE